MLFIDIQWDFISPFLRHVSGKVSVYKSNINNIHKKDLLFTCKVIKERGFTEFQEIYENKGLPLKIFETVRPILSIIVENYYLGVCLKGSSCEWVHDLVVEGLEKLTEQNPVFKDLEK